MSYDCDICKDVGFIIDKEGPYEIATKCKCQRLKEIKQRHNNSGIGDLLDTKTFDNYIVRNKYQDAIKQTAVKYVKEYREGNRYSLAILGQSGTGKTHITVAVARQLIELGADVKYFIADDIIQNLQACKFDEENYNREFSKVANAGVLFLDDLFKTSIKNYYNKESIDTGDLREIFKIINYRYNKGLPMLINSEIEFERFAKLDQAIIGRINEMCNYEYLLTIGPDQSKNYRLNKRW